MKTEVGGPRVAPSSDLRRTSGGIAVRPDLGHGYAADRRIALVNLGWATGRCSLGMLLTSPEAEDIGNEVAGGRFGVPIRSAATCANGFC